MKVMSFVVGTANGLTESMERLDARVAELGKVTIWSVTDTVYQTQDPKYPEIIRVVVYEPRT